MPLTFPSHAAAILPLLHLPGTRRNWAVWVVQPGPDQEFAKNRGEVAGRLAHLILVPLLACPLVRSRTTFMTTT